MKAALKAHIQALKALNAKTVKAGWFASNRYPDGYSVAQNAAFQNSGGVIKRGDHQIVIPARPFMDLAGTNVQTQQSATAKQLINQVLRQNEEAPKALAKIGLLMENEIKKAIVQGEWAPNAPSTVKKKGFNKPLVDSGILLKTVASKVDD